MENICTNHRSKRSGNECDTCRRKTEAAGKQQSETESDKRCRKERRGNTDSFHRTGNKVRDRRHNRDCGNHLREVPDIISNLTSQSREHQINCNQQRNQRSADINADFHAVLLSWLLHLEALGAVHLIIHRRRILSARLSRLARRFCNFLRIQRCYRQIDETAHNNRNNQKDDSPESESQIRQSRANQSEEQKRQSDNHQED